MSNYKTTGFLENFVKLYNSTLEADTFDGVEVYPAKVAGLQGDEPVLEQCNEGEEDVWCVYLHLNKGGLECVAACDAEDCARQLADLLKLAGGFPEF